MMRFTKRSCLVLLQRLRSPQICSPQSGDAGKLWCRASLSPKTLKV